MTEVAERSDDAVVYTRLAPELLRFATGLVGRGDAADVVSTAFTKSLGSPSWPAVENRRAFLYRAVFNESARWTQRRAERPIRERAINPVVTVELPDYDPTVAAAVAALSVRQRAVIVLTYWADLDPLSVSEYLGISEGSVRRHLARARAQLRKVLQ